MHPINEANQGAEAFALLVDGAVDFALFLLDADGHISSWNRGGERLLGYRAEEVLGRHFRLFYNPDEVARGVPDQLLRRAASEGCADNERWHVRKDGSRFWASGVDRALYDEAGRVCGFAIVFRDQTEQKLLSDALRQSEERLRLMIEGATDHAIFALDRQGRVTEWSAGAERILEYTEEEAMGQHAAFIFTPEDRERGAPALEMGNALTEGRAEDERWHLKKNGQRFWGSGVLTSIYDEDNNLRGFVKVFRDLTARRLAEEARMEAERHASVLEERNRMARELHDTLAQGFTGIKLHLDAAEDALDEDIHEAKRLLVRAREVARESQVEARRSIRALRVQWLETGDLRSSLATLVNQAMVSPGPRVQLVVEGTPYTLPAPVESDLFRIAQEALTNALQHAQARHIWVRLTYAGPRLTLAVRDDGQGFDPQGTKKHGLGLEGLRERAERLRAELSIDSAAGQGTEVAVHFDMALLTS